MHACATLHGRALKVYVHDALPLSPCADGSGYIADGSGP